MAGTRKTSEGSPRARIKPGAVIDGRYRIDDVLGEGGMGLVLAAREIATERAVAIKVLLADVRVGGTAHARFLREARASTVIQNAHAIRVLDTGTVDGAPFIVMERLDGFDLARVLKVRGALPVAQAVLAIVQACEAIQAAHAHGIVHRDIKPSNLFVARGDGGSERIVVLDFGISKLAVPDGASNDLTTTAEVFGSPRYMSPEQVRSSKNVDGRADIWALGVVAYEALTGTRPFTADSMGALAALILEEAPAPLRALRPELPEALEAVVLRCLEKKPDARFSQARELADALAPFAKDAKLALLAGVTPRAPDPDGAARHDDGPTSTRTVPPSGDERADEVSTQLQAGVTRAKARPRRTAAVLFGLGITAGGITAGTFLVVQTLSNEPAAAPSTGNDAQGRRGPCTERARKLYPNARQPLRLQLGTAGKHVVASQWFLNPAGVDATVMQLDSSLAERAPAPFRLNLGLEPLDTRVIVTTLRDEAVGVAALRQAAQGNAGESTLFAMAPLEPPAGPFAARGLHRAAHRTTDLAAIVLPDMLLAVSLGTSTEPGDRDRNEIWLGSLFGARINRRLTSTSVDGGGTDIPRNVSAASGTRRAVVVARSNAAVRSFIVTAERDVSPLIDIGGQNDVATVVARGDEFFVVWRDDAKRFAFRRLPPDRTEFEPAKFLPMADATNVVLTSHGDRLFVVWREGHGVRRIRYGVTRGSIEEIPGQEAALEVEAEPIAAAATADGLWIGYRAVSLGIASLACP